MLNRRDFLRKTGLACLSGSATPLLNGLLNTTFESGGRCVRCVNVVNFIRGVEPRFATDLLLPVRKQMEVILETNLPATWLLQFDALVSGDFVNYLKAHKAADHEVGFWFEMNEMLCHSANVDWRGRPGFEWDHLPPVAFTIGYTPEERVKLADAAMFEFKKIWGAFPKAVASWNLDAITMAHLVDRYKIDAFAVCRDQIATDGFTIWGAPIAGYYPNQSNCWSPALEKDNQIDAPIFRMLGQDPVHYYNRRYQTPDGQTISQPDTMEPVWTSGRSRHFITSFLDMISQGPSLKFAYAQLGQENSFPWADMAQAYPEQMRALARLRESGAVTVETMGASGRRFKKAFRTTPAQAQVMLDDPFGPMDSIEKTVWYQSRYYRANLHFKGDLPYFRDITVYSDRFPQPFLKEATRQNDVEQRMPAVLDGVHWTTTPDSLENIGSGGFFVVDGQRLRSTARPQVRETGNNLTVEIPVDGGQTLEVTFMEKSVSLRLTSKTPNGLSLAFEWDPQKSALRRVLPDKAIYSFQGFEFVAKIRKGQGKATSGGWTIHSVSEQIHLELAQLDG